MWLCWVVGLFLCASMACNTIAAEQNFSWLPNHETDLAGYKIHYGPASREYTNTVDIGLPDAENGRIHAKVIDLPDGAMFFAATAYDSAGRESDYSKELSANPPPGEVQGFTVTTTTTTITTTTIAQ